MERKKMLEKMKTVWRRKLRGSKKKKFVVG